jgi:NAD(P)-dependent dehydrogenase (short-subunit alcohol dehydrogenase family)
MAQEFARQGLRLGLCARSAPALPASDTIVTAQLDVSDGRTVDEFAARVSQRLGPIDLWINNAGVLEPIAPLRELETDALRRHLEVNLIGVFHGTRSYVHHLRRTGRPGVLINISSGAAWHGYAGWTAYCASKAAVDRLTECVALEERSIGLRAHAVAPGIIDTDMQDLIRRCRPEQFPMVDKFLQIKRENAFNSPAFVARELLAIAFDPARTDSEVVLRLPNEKG